MYNKIIVWVAVVVVLVLAIGGFFWWQGATTTTTPIVINEQQNQNDENPVVDIEVTPVVPKTHEVTYTNAGYAPATLDVKAGDTVTFKNQSSGNVWTGSAMHPTHVVYSGTALAQHCPDPENDDFDQCKNEGPGTSWSFTFTKAGSWGYHNHANSKHFGKVVVE